MSKADENRRVKDRKRRRRLKLLGYTQEEAAEIVKIRSKLAAQGADLTLRIRQQCVTGKIVYSSMRTASDVARDLRVNNVRFSKNLHPYECRYCKMWHLSSRKERSTK